MVIPQESDFPPGTVFLSESFEIPLVLLPDGIIHSWYGGKPMQWDDAHLRALGIDPLDVLTQISFGHFASVVKHSVDNTVDDRRRAEERYVSILKQILEKDAAKARRTAKRVMLLVGDEKVTLDAKVKRLFHEWKISTPDSIFPLETKFFVKGDDLPVALLPGQKAISWYGGLPTEWDNDRLVFAKSDSNEPFDEVSFEEFIRVVADSLDSSFDRNKAFDEEAAPTLARLKDDRAFSGKRPAVDCDDYMHSRPDKYGIWRDSDGDPI